MTQCLLLYVYRRYREAYWLHLHGPKSQIIWTPAAIEQAARRPIAKDLNLQQLRCKKIKFQV